MSDTGWLGSVPTPNGGFWGITVALLAKTKRVIPLQRCRPRLGVSDVFCQASPTLGLEKLKLVLGSAGEIKSPSATILWLTFVRHAASFVKL